MKLRNLFLIISILCIQAVTAQTKQVLKARENFANGKYPEARKYCIGGLKTTNPPLSFGILRQSVSLKCINWKNTERKKPIILRNP